MASRFARSVARAFSLGAIWLAGARMSMTAADEQAWEDRNRWWTKPMSRWVDAGE